MIDLLRSLQFLLRSSWVIFLNPYLPQITWTSQTVSKFLTDIIWPHFEPCTVRQTREIVYLKTWRGFVWSKLIYREKNLSSSWYSLINWLSVIVMMIFVNIFFHLAVGGWFFLSSFHAEIEKEWEEWDGGFSLVSFAYFLQYFTRFYSLRLDDLNPCFCTSTHVQPFI
jgi:hypothetical protein